MKTVGRSTSRLLDDPAPSHATQYLAALSATMGVLSVGSIVGYTSPVGPLLLANSTSLQLTQGEFNWFSSSLNLGTAAGGLVGGVCINTLGRRGTMLSSVLPCLVGWALIGAAQNFGMLMTGRVVNGVFAGVTCITVPTYIGEFASPDVRGTLGSGFQLLMSVGVLFAYSLGVGVTNWRWLAAACAAPNVLYLVMVLFIRESPYFLLSKGKSKLAETSLQYFRGKHYNTQREMDMIRRSLEDAQHNKAALRDLLLPYNLKPLLIGIFIFLSVQFSGFTAVTFNMATVFEESGVGLDEDVSSVITVAVQFVPTVFCAILMDKAGRKFWLIISYSCMALSLVALGVYFNLKEQDAEWTSDHLSWLPLTALIVFTSGFALGCGPCPWILLGELFSPGVKELSVSLVSLINWLFCFIMTFIFQPLTDAIGDDGAYYLFAGMTVLSLVFIVVVVPETKGKTLQEITAYFGGPDVDDSASNREDIAVIRTEEVKPERL